MRYPHAIMVLLCATSLNASLEQSSTNSFLARPFALSYAQSGKNCPSVAITKWLLATYGVNPPSGAFSSKTDPATGTIAVSLPGNKTISITQAEVAIASRRSGFVLQQLDDVTRPPDNSFRKDAIVRANLLYAVLAVRKAATWDGSTLSNHAFKHQIQALGKGGSVDDLFELLGFSLHDTDRLTGAQDAFVFGNESEDGGISHVVFGFHEEGKNRYDEHGSVSLLDLSDFTETYGGGSVCQYSLETPDNGVPFTNRFVVARRCISPLNSGTWRSCQS